MTEVRGLTVRQPWAWAIAHGGKDIENRSWPPLPLPDEHVLLIHAGKGFDDECCQSVAAKSGRSVAEVTDGARAALGAIVAVAEIVGVCKGCSPACSSWSVTGEWHWMLGNVRPLAEPVPARGALGLWRPDPEVLAAVAAQVPVGELVRGETTP